MAFSSFRLMMAASFTVTPPPPADTDVEAAESMTSLFAATGYLGTSNSITAGTGSTYYATTSLSNASTVGTYAMIITRSTSYSYVSNTLLLNSSSTANKSSISSVDSTHFLTAFGDTTSAIYAAYVTNTSGTLGLTTGPTTVVTGGGALSNSDCVVLDSSNALVIGTSATTANNRISLINPSALTVTQSNTSASTIQQSNDQYSIFKISSTLALVSWLDASNNYQISTIDVTSGVSFTLNAAHNCGALGGHSFAQFYALSSLTALMVYYKSSNTLGARVVTLGVGGVVTLHTEYTTTTSGINIAFAPFKIAAYASSYAIAWGQNVANDAQCYFTSLNILGNVISWDSASPSIINSAPNYAPSYNNSPGSLIDIDSTHLGVSYPTVQTWGAFAGNNSGSATNAGTLDTYTTLPVFQWSGTNTIIGSGTIGSGNLKYYCLTLLGGQNATILAGSLVDTGVSGGAVSTMCSLAFDATNSIARVLTAYGSGTNTMMTRVISQTAGGTLSLGSSTTFTATSVTVANGGGWYNLINLAADTSMFIGYNNNTTPKQLFANIITTSAESAPTANTYSSIINITNEDVQNPAGEGNLQYCVIDSTHVAISFITINTSTSNYSMWVCILSVSGTTITAGTPVSVFTNFSNLPQLFGIVSFSNGTGIVTYNNDAGPATQILAKGFTYSGTTVTLGTANTLATGLHLPDTIFQCSGNPMMTKLSTTQAILMNTDSTNSPSNDYLRIVTYVNVNSVTSGTAFSVGTVGNGYATIGLIPTDNYNNTFCSFTQTPNSKFNISQWYRN